MAEAMVPTGSSGRTKFLIGGFLIIAAVIYLVVTSTQASAQYYMTVEEMLARRSELSGRTLKLSGAVDGESIVYETESLTLSFTMADLPGDLNEIEQAGGLAKALHDALKDPAATRVEVVYIGPKPDLLRHEAQAIVTGEIGEDGVFYADELLLKCPTRYEEEVPLQAEGA
jgi:cytochrome c-type biogenesis protein CcmE